MGLLILNSCDKLKMHTKQILGTQEDKTGQQGATFFLFLRGHCPPWFPFGGAPA